MSESTTIDPKYQRLMEFAKNFSNKSNHTSFSNLYLLQAVDKDGNVVDEKYGMNLFTNYGMSQYFVSHVAFPTNLYIGNGSGSFNHTSNTLLSPIITTAATVSSSAKNYAYPLYYSSLEGLVTTVMQYMEVYFDYNPTGIEGPVDISEYGIGTAYNALWTHSWVYNSAGEKSVIRKEVNTRLYITVFMCMTFNTSLITTAWDENKYICITNQSRFFNRSSVSMEESALYTFRRYDYYQRSKSHTQGYADNISIITSNMSAFLLSKISTSTTEQNGYIDGFISWNTGFNMFERVTLDYDISFDIVGTPLSSYFTKVDGFSYSIGDTVTGKIPFTSMTLTGSYTLNYKTGAYTCPDHYVYDPSKWYNEMAFDKNFRTALRFTNNNEIITIYLFRNMKQDDPIVAITNSLTNLYATDEYWNTSSWVRIENMSTIPAALQTKKYWLTTDDLGIEVKRGKQTLEYIASDNVSHAPTLHFPTNSYNYGALYSATDPSSAKKWFAIGNKIYVVSRNDLVIELSSSINVPHGYGDWVIHWPYSNPSTSIYVTHITDPIPEPVQTTLANSVSLSGGRVTESETGYMIISRYTSSSSTNGKTVKIDMTGNTFVQTALPDAIDAACICQSNTYAYIDKTNTRQVFVKRLSDDSLIKQIDIRADYSAPTIVFGFKNYVYIMKESQYIYMYNTSTDVLTELSTTVPSRWAFTQDHKGILMSSCSGNCFLIYAGGSSSPKSDGAYAVTEYDPMTVVDVSAGMPNEYYHSSPHIMKIASVNNDSIVLMWQTDNDSSGASYRAWVECFDLGAYLYAQSGSLSKVIDRNANYTYTVVPFGEFAICRGTVFPLANMLRHRLTGTTRCVTTCDEMKRVTGKKWTLQVTNLGSFVGIPPGTRQ